jgi:protein-L-isoaspartate(D-aspartate) O-methyltransferase
MRPDPANLALERMVREQIAGRDLRDPRLLAAMLAVDRAAFVPERLRHAAYEDRPLPIGYGQTISQPYMVARMTAELGLTGGERVLEIGAGSGYQTAILARLAGDVFAIEYVRELAEQARATLDSLGLTNVHLKAGDGTLGWPEAAPFDRILAAAAAPDVPPPLLEQLAEGGVLVMPLGATGGQRLVKIVRHRGRDVRTEFCPCTFVLMRGRWGF